MTGSDATPRGLLIDFGGVLTTDVIASFRSFGTRRVGDPMLIERTPREDHEAARLLVEHESGRLEADAFERGLCERLAAQGVDAQPEGLLDDLLRGVVIEPRMLELVGHVRASGIPVALVSNQLGRDSYAGVDLNRLFDAVVLSADVGVRKPSRRITRSCAIASSSRRRPV
jgi:putative hydrolase of the HAD superfamily